MNFSRYGYNPRIFFQKYLGTDGQKQKRDGKAGHIEKKQDTARERIALLQGNAQHHGQGGADTRRPSEGKEEAEGKCSEQAFSGGNGRGNGPRTVQKRNFQEPGLMDPHEHNDRTAEQDKDPALKNGPRKTCADAHEKEHRGNTCHKGKRFFYPVHARRTGRLPFGRKIPEVERQQGQDARRKKREHSCGKHGRTESDMHIQRITS